MKNFKSDLGLPFNINNGKNSWKKVWCRWTHQNLISTFVPDGWKRWLNSLWVPVITPVFIHIGKYYVISFCISEYNIIALYVIFQRYIYLYLKENIN